MAIRGPNSILHCILLFTSSPSFASTFQPPPNIFSLRVSTSKRIMTSSTNNADDFIQVPLLTSQTLQELVEYATSFSASHGLQVQARHTGSGASESVGDGQTRQVPKKSFVTAPISLLPQSYPATLFQQATQLAPPLNLLVEKISRDGMFLKETLKDVREVDPYTGKLLNLYEEIYLGERMGESWGRHARNADRLGINRSDYMLHQTNDSDGQPYALKQVELNTIASSFAGLASTVAKLHGFLTTRMERDGTLKEFFKENNRCVSVSNDEKHAENVDGVPESPAMTRLPLAISVAYDRYCQRFIKDKSGSENVRPAVLFVVQPNETNTVDQRMLEFALWTNHQIPVIRMTLGEIYKNTILNEDTGKLVIKSDCINGDEVAVVYFRAGYAPTDYPSGYNTFDNTGIEWLARERLERSCATKCPNLGYHLAGTKKVQQELARMGAVERFFPLNGESEEYLEIVAMIRSAFAGLFSLGADATDQDLNAVKDILFNGGEGRFVLKPQREGGGYNYYGKNLAKMLKDNCTITQIGEGRENSVQLNMALSEFILMERLFPPQQRAVLLRNGQVEGTGMTISELGCFGTIVSTYDSEVVHNEYAGFLLRTKFSGVDEGGVASGYATLSSPYLC